MVWTLHSPPPSNTPPVGNSNDTSLSRGELMSKNIVKLLISNLCELYGR